MRKSFEEIPSREHDLVAKTYQKELQDLMEKIDKVPLSHLTVGDMRFIQSFINDTPDGPDLDVLERFLYKISPQCL